MSISSYHFISSKVFIRRGQVGEVFGVEEPRECYMTYTTERAEKEVLKLYKRELKCSHQQAIKEASVHHTAISCTKRQQTPVRAKTTAAQSINSELR